jgi:hypothetical protein
MVEIRLLSSRSTLLSSIFVQFLAGGASLISHVSGKYILVELLLWESYSHCEALGKRV